MNRSNPDNQVPDPSAEDAQLAKLRSDLDAANAEIESLRRELLPPRVFMQLLEWLRQPEPKSASGAFTAGMARQIAYALEMDVLPEVKRLRAQLATSQAEAQLAAMRPNPKAAVHVKSEDLASLVTDLDQAIGPIQDDELLDLMRRCHGALITLAQERNRLLSREFICIKCGLRSDYSVSGTANF